MSTLEDFIVNTTAANDQAAPAREIVACHRPGLRINQPPALAYFDTANGLFRPAPDVLGLAGFAPIARQVRNKRNIRNS